MLVGAVTELWDGTDDNEVDVPPGRYRVSISSVDVYRPTIVDVGYEPQILDIGPMWD
jgi:flagellar hook assembly protein FlgD